MNVVTATQTAAERAELEPAEIADWLGIGRYGTLACRSTWVDTYYKGALVFLISFGLTFGGYVLGLAGRGWTARVAPLAGWLLASAFVLTVCGLVTEIQATADGLLLRRGRRRARVAWDDLRAVSRRVENGIVYLRLCGGRDVFWLGVTNRAALRLAYTIRRIEAARRRGRLIPGHRPLSERAISRPTEPPGPGIRSVMRVAPPVD